MFVRRKLNKSGSISITVVDKSRGRYDVVRSFGTARTAAEADLLENKAREWVREQSGEPDTLFDRMDEAQLRAYAATLNQGRIELAGPELIYGELFDRLSCGMGEDPLFRHLVISRLVEPGSKLKVRGYLRRYLGEDCTPEAIYALVDRLRLNDKWFASGIPASCAVVAVPPLRGVKLCVILTEEGRPQAARFVDRKLSGAALEQAVQRFGRKYCAVAPLNILKRGDAVKELGRALRMSKVDAEFKPMNRRLKGRMEGHVCICLAAFAIEGLLADLMRERGIDAPVSEVREAVQTLFRLNYVSPYTHRPKSVLLKMSPLQKQLFDLLHEQ